MKKTYTGREFLDRYRNKSRGVSVFLQPVGFYHVSNDICKESSWVLLADWHRDYPEDTPEDMVKRTSR